MGVGSEVSESIPGLVFLSLSATFGSDVSSQPPVCRHATCHSDH